MVLTRAPRIKGRRVEGGDILRGEGWRGDMLGGWVTYYGAEGGGGDIYLSLIHI